MVRERTSGTLNVQIATYATSIESRMLVSKGSLKYSADL